MVKALFYFNRDFIDKRRRSKTPPPYSI